MSTEDPDLSSGEEWSDLDKDDQDQILQERLEEQEPASSTGEFEFAEMGEQETADTLERIQEKKQETWMGTVLDDLAMEFYTLTDAQVKELKGLMSLFSQVQGVETVDDLDDEAVEALESADETLEQLLDEVTVDDRLDQDYWAEGDYPASLKMQVFQTLMEKYREEVGQTKN